jgi:hypothetical protein
MTEADLIEHAKAFVAAVAAAEPREIIEDFYAQDVVQEEFPNLLRPHGAVRDFINLRAAYDKSRYALAEQSYEVVNAMALGHCTMLKRSGMRRWLLVSANSRLVTGYAPTLPKSSNSGTV